MVSTYISMCFAEPTWFSMTAEHSVTQYKHPHMKSSVMFSYTHLAAARLYWTAAWIFSSASSSRSSSLSDNNDTYVL